MAERYDLSVIFKVIDKASTPIKKIGNALKGLVRPTERQAKAFDELSKKMDKVSGQFTATGAALTKGLTLPITAFGTLATKKAIDFETAWIGVVKTVQTTPERLEKLRMELSDLALQIPLATEEIFGIGEAAGQLSIQVPTIAKFTRVIADLAATTDLESKTAAMSLAKFANITKMSQKDFDRLGSSIAHLGNNTATTESAIVEMARRLAAAGSKIKLTVPEILGFAAALSSVGLEAEMGGTAFSQLILRITKEVGTGSNKLKAFAKITGKSVEDFEKAWKEDGAETLFEFIKGLKGLEERGLNVSLILDKLGFTGVRLTDVIGRASLAQEQFKKTVKLSSDAWAENVALVNEANLRYGTTASKLQILRNRFFQAIVPFGDILTDVLLEVGDLTKPLLSFFKEMTPEAKKFTIVFSAFLAILGPLLVALGAVIGLFAIVVGSVGAVVAGVAAATAAFIGLAAGIATVVAYWDDLKFYFGEWWKDVKSIFSGNIEEIKNMLIDFALTVTNLPMGVMRQLGIKLPTFKRDTTEENVQLARERLAANRARIGLPNPQTQTDINIKLKAEQGTEATIDKVQTRRGTSNVKIATEGYVGGF